MIDVNALNFIMDFISPKPVSRVIRVLTKALAVS